MLRVALSLLIVYLFFGGEIKDFITDKMIERNMRKSKIDEAVIKAFIIANKKK